MNEKDLALVRAKLAQLLDIWKDVPVGLYSEREGMAPGAPGLYLSLRLWRELAKVVADL